jgi:hypothetical protein
MQAQMGLAACFRDTERYNEAQLIYQELLASNTHNNTANILNDFAFLQKTSK